MENKKEFNIIIAGVGGQGVITLLRVLAEAALIEGYQPRTSELHGLSQRGGSLQAHLRIGPSALLGTSSSTSLGTSKAIFSPLVSQAKADLILALEMSEALRPISFANKRTSFLINEKFIPFFGGPGEKDIVQKIKKLAQKKTYLIRASEICSKEFKKEILAGVYLVSWAAFKEIIPLEPNSILKGLDRVISKKYLSLNKKAFQLAQKKARD